MKDLFGLMHTRWTSEVVDITWRLTKMIAHDIIISIFRLLKYDRIFGKDLDNDTWSVSGNVFEIYVSFLFYGTFKWLW